METGNKILCKLIFFEREEKSFENRSVENCVDNVKNFAFPRVWPQNAQSFPQGNHRLFYRKRFSWAG